MDLRPAGAHRRPGQQVVPRRDDVRRLGQPRPRRLDPHHPRVARRWHQLHRHRRRLRAGRVRGDRRQGAQGPPRRRHPRHQVPRPDGRGPQPAGQLAALDHRARSRTRCAGSNRLDRPLPGAPPRPDTDVEETLGALTDLVRQGKVRYIGHSTFPASQIVEAQWVARERDLQRFVTEQPPTRSSSAASRRTSCPPASATAWASLLQPVDRRLAVGTLAQGRRPADLITSQPAARALRPLPARQPAQARRRRGARAARRRRRHHPDPASHRLRPQPPGDHLGHHRPAHHGATRGPARSADVALDSGVLDRIDEIESRPETPSTPSITRSTTRPSGREPVGARTSDRFCATFPCRGSTPIRAHPLTSSCA